MVYCSRNYQICIFLRQKNHLKREIAFTQGQLRQKLEASRTVLFVSHVQKRNCTFFNLKSVIVRHRFLTPYAKVLFIHKHLKNMFVPVNFVMVKWSFYSTPSPIEEKLIKLRSVTRVALVIKVIKSYPAKCETFLPNSSS